MTFLVRCPLKRPGARVIPATFLVAGIAGKRDDVIGATRSNIPGN